MTKKEMTEELKQTIQEEMTILPKEMQEAINSFDWIDESEKIGKNHFLRDEEVNLLQAEIASALLGIEGIYMLDLNIGNTVGMSKKEAEDITKEITEKIISPICDIMMEKIKKTMPGRVVNWQQNINFILSGGNYASFIMEPKKEEGIREKIDIGTKFNDSKLDDLKSTFTI